MSTSNNMNKTPAATTQQEQKLLPDTTPPSRFTLLGSVKVCPPDPPSPSCCRPQDLEWQSEAMERVQQNDRVFLPIIPDTAATAAATEQPAGILSRRASTNSTSISADQLQPRGVLFPLPLPNEDISLSALFSGELNHQPNLEREGSRTTLRPRHHATSISNNWVDAEELNAGSDHL